MLSKQSIFGLLIPLLFILPAEIAAGNDINIQTNNQTIRVGNGVSVKTSPYRTNINPQSKSWLEFWSFPWLFQPQKVNPSTQCQQSNYSQQFHQSNRSTNDYSYSESFTSTRVCQ